MKENNYQLIFDYLPGIYLIIKPNAPHFTIIGFNKAQAETTMADATAIGRDLFEVFTDNVNNPQGTGVENLRNSLLTVIQTKKPHTMGLQRYDLLNPQTQQFEERYWLPVNIPVFDENQKLIYIIHAVEEVTEKVLLQEKENKAQQQLQHLHQEYALTLESIADGFFSTDKNWRVKYWNKQAEGIFNISHKDILGNYLWDFIREDSGTKIHEYLNKALQENKPVHFEAYYFIRNIWLQVNAYPAEQGLTVFLVDITERKQAEEKLRKNEQRFRAMIENISDGLAIISREGVVQDISASGKKMLGVYYSNTIIGKNYSNLVFPADLPRIQQAFDYTLQYESISAPKSAATQNGFQSTINRHKAVAESNMITFRGARLIERKLMWFEGSFHNLLHEEAIQAIVFTFRDITKRREQEIRLKNSEEKYRSLFQNTPASIIIWELDGFRIREVNQASLSLFHFTYPQLLLMTLHDLMQEVEHGRITHTALEFKKGNTTGNGVYQCKNRQGNTIYVHLTFYKIIFAARDAVLTLGTDVTEQINLQKKLDEEQTRRQQQITEAVLTAQENERAELGKELHDNINQILTTTRLYIEHALTKPGKQEELLRYSKEYISKAILEIRQLSRRLMPPSLEEVSLKQGLEELFSNLKALNNYRFAFEFLLEHEEQINNEQKLAIFRIIQEGLNNIFKHAKATEVNVRIEQKEKSIEVCIEDNGIGFNPQKSTPGLGLRNISNRASLFSGQVILNSQTGKGTELKVRFPVL